MTTQQIKEYVIKTIKGGNKLRIQAVLKRYQEYLKEYKNSAQEAKQDKLVSAAKEMFDI